MVPTRASSRARRGRRRSTRVPRRRGALVEVESARGRAVVVSSVNRSACQRSRPWRPRAWPRAARCSRTLVASLLTRATRPSTRRRRPPRPQPRDALATLPQSPRRRGDSGSRANQRLDRAADSTMDSPRSRAHGPRSTVHGPQARVATLSRSPIASRESPSRRSTVVEVACTCRSRPRAPAPPQDISSPGHVLDRVESGHHGLQPSRPRPTEPPPARVPLRANRVPRQLDFRLRLASFRRSDACAGVLVEISGPAFLGFSRASADRSAPTEVTNEFTNAVPAFAKRGRVLHQKGAGAPAPRPTAPSPPSHAMMSHCKGP